METNHNELICELRDQADVLGPGTECDMLRRAADVIEQQDEEMAIKPKIEKTKTSLLFEGDCIVTLALCGKCGMPIEEPIDEESPGWKYCPNCGKRVKWDDD